MPYYIDSEPRSRPLIVAFVLHDHAWPTCSGWSARSSRTCRCAWARAAWVRTGCCSRWPTSSSWSPRKPDSAPRQHAFLFAGAVSGHPLGADFDFGDPLRHRHHVAGVTTTMQLTDLNIGVLFMLALSLDGRVRHRAGRLGVQQQIRAAGRPAQFGADDQL